MQASLKATVLEMLRRMQRQTVSRVSYILIRTNVGKWRRSVQYKMSLSHCGNQRKIFMVGTTLIYMNGHYINEGEKALLCISRSGRYYWHSLISYSSKLKVYRIVLASSHKCNIKISIRQEVQRKEDQTRCFWLVRLFSWPGFVWWLGLLFWHIHTSLNVCERSVVG